MAKSTLAHNAAMPKAQNEATNQSGAGNMTSHGSHEGAGA